MSWDIFNIFGRRAPREAGQEAVVRDRPRRSSVRLSFRSSKRWNRGSHSDPQTSNPEPVPLVQQQLRSSSEEQRPTKRVKELTNGTEKQRRELQQREEELRQREEELRQREEELRQREEELQQREEELRQREEELQWREEELRQRNSRLNHLSSENQKLRKSGKSSCRRCEDQARENRQTLSEMEAFYKDKLTEARSALKEKEEQLRSFKDRVAQNVVLSLKTENTENMNSPVNQSRLTEMYQQLRVCTWPNIHFSSSDAQARALVQKAFDEAAKHIKVLRTSMRKLCVFRTSPKVEKFRQTALENLQLALFHSSREDVFKAAFPQSYMVREDQLLASECYWLGCLMALHSPPLRPDWDSADDQSVFPRDIRPERRHSNIITHV